MNPHILSHREAFALNRRAFMYRLGYGLGGLAFTSLLARDLQASVLAPKKPHHDAKAKACIFLLMEGGPSHIDTFDPKPKLDALHLKEFVRDEKFASAMASGKRYYVKSPFRFRKAGKSGIDICENFEHLADCVDDLCIYKGATAQSVNHPTALYHLNTGNQFGGDPAIGSWVTYGLGAENQNLPAFMVLPEVAYPQGGSANWSNGYLPAYFQGTPLRPAGSPILDLNPPDGVTRQRQRTNLDLLAELNRLHQGKYPGHEDLPARLENYELAYRMQTEVPELLSLENENAETKALYGLDDNETHDFGRRCLLARRLIEKGVRFVQLYSGGWDSHDYIEKAHSSRIRSVDKPIAGLLKDLKRRGMLDSTLVIWGGEFGRSPDNGIRGGGVQFGRDHNAKGMSMWFAGGGVKSGHVIGATDETGEKAVEVVRPLKDVHCTILHLLGLDDNKLTHFHGGRFKQLSQVGGAVIKELLG
ncbi:MAG: DUF1501 domain-containing protein [Verrucomicrobia bacterium]|nr:DUF1501 domain-containing protein [Verrucomicrobiota bacterium]